MIAATATATEMKNNFGYYLNLVMNGQEVIVTKNGKEVGRFVPQKQVESFLSDQLIGVLKKARESQKDLDYHEELDQILNEKYEIAD